MGAKRNIVATSSTDDVKVVKSKGAAKPKEEPITEKHVQVNSEVAENAENAAETGTTTTNTAAAKKAKKERVRSHKYTLTRSQVDKTKTYDPFAAVELVKKLSYTKFPGTITADVLLRDVGTTATLTFPHSTGKTIRVAIVTDDVIAKIEAGQIDFDILVTSAQYMPKLAKLARVLGPKGLMPNPKNGTITDNPERKKQELEGGKITLKSEKKAPLMHVNLGKVSMETHDLVANLNALIDALKGKVLKLSLSASMSPSIKVQLA